MVLLSVEEGMGSWGGVRDFLVLDLGSGCFLPVGSMAVLGSAAAKLRPCVT